MNAPDVERVILGTEPNQGYAADQIEDSMTLRDLLRAIEEAIEEWGPDVMIVTRDGGNRYGANYGRISTWTDTFTVEDEDEDEDE